MQQQSISKFFKKRPAPPPPADTSLLHSPHHQKIRQQHSKAPSALASPAQAKRPRVGVGEEDGGAMRRLDTGMVRRPMDCNVIARGLRVDLDRIFLFDKNRRMLTTMTSWSLWRTRRTTRGMGWRSSG